MIMAGPARPVKRVAILEPDAEKTNRGPRNTRKRTPKSSKRPKRTTAVGGYTIVVKVIDILGNDTTKAVRVKVP